MDYVAGVVGGGIHGGHAGGVFGGGCFEQAPVDGDFDVAGEEALQHFQRRLFEDVVARFGLFRKLNGQQALDGERLGHDAFEFVVEEIDGVDFAFGVAVNCGAGDGGGVFVFNLVEQVDVLGGDGGTTAAEGIAAFAAGCDEFHLGGALVGKELGGGFDEIGVEGTGQTFIGGEQDELDAFLFAAGQERASRCVFIAGGTVCQVCHHPLEHGGIGAGGNDAILRAAQFGGRDHLHGLGDLLGVFDGADAPPDVYKTRHSGLGDCRFWVFGGLIGDEAVFELFERVGERLFDFVELLAFAQAFENGGL